MWQGFYQVQMSQWGVGHGGFHSQIIAFQKLKRPNAERIGDPETFSLIYDCGSGRGRVARKSFVKAVTRMLNSFPVSQSVDLLVISHFDADHINGLSHLAAELRSRTPVVEVKKVWAPILSKIEALYLIAQSADTGEASADLAAFLNDPESALTEFFPGAEIDFIPYGSEPVPLEQMRNEESDRDAQQTGGPTPISLVNADDSGAVILSADPAEGREVLWEFRPYATESALVGANSVATAVAKLLKKPVGQCSVSDMLNLARDKTLLGKFHAAVRAHHSSNATAGRKYPPTGANLSSLCVYSGPAFPYDWCAYRGGWDQIDADREAIPFAPSWLGTGDASLAKQVFVDEMANRFTQSRLDRVGIASAPHHGSYLDSDAPLWDALPNVRMVTIEADNNVGYNGGHRHPHSQVLTELSSRGIQIKFATQNNDFRWLDRRFR